MRFDRNCGCKTRADLLLGRKNDAAVRLGIGRNTLTRKVQELKIDAR